MAVRVMAGDLYPDRACAREFRRVHMRGLAMVRAD